MSTVFQNVAPYSLIEVNRRFGGNCCLRLQSHSAIQGRKWRGACCLLVLLFDSEDGNSSLLPKRPLTYTRQYGTPYQKTVICKVTAVKITCRGLFVYTFVSADFTVSSERMINEYRIDTFVGDFCLRVCLLRTKSLKYANYNFA
jgi:hypothetical protein